MTAILGVSAFYHDAAAALVVDGRIVAAAQEERFSRRKHDARFPAQAIQYCLEEAGITAAELDYVVFYEKPLRKFERLLETYVATAPRGFRAFFRAMPVWLRQKLYLPREIRRELGGAYRRRIAFVEHHQSHAASAFFPSPFDEAAILTADGVGEWAAATIGVGRGNRIELRRQLDFPHSPGLLYSAFTAFCGFRVNSGEYKLMGLAPYGEPRYVALIREKLLDLKDDGSFRLDMRCFRYHRGLTMTSRRFEHLFGGPPRRPEAPITQREMDLAASIQKVVEEVLLRMARFAAEETGMKHLTMAGGVALNCVANGRILREGSFDALWIQPAAGDAGGALGAALFLWHQLLDRPRTANAEDQMQGARLGPAFSDNEIEAVLEEAGARFRRFDDDESLCVHVASLLTQGKVVGWVQGRMEFGPRALGSRSILADPRPADMQQTVNRKIKFRESFRPLAPAVLAERAAEFFELRPGEESPYMLLTAAVQPAKRVVENASVQGRGLDCVGEVRSVIPAVTHVDGSARVQTVDAQRDPRLYRLLKAFEAQTGCPVLVNTSFNVRGEPIVCTPHEAWRGFLATGMDALVLERFVLLKEDQPPIDEAAIAAHLHAFADD